MIVTARPSQDAHKQLEWAQATGADAGFNASSSLIPGDVEIIIARVARELGTDLQAMGACACSPLRSLLLGSKTLDLLRSSGIPTLLLR